jgi:Na+-transporting methylmalonyl-CoA/oxaloacetate decarboxylase gamma subunit
MRDPLTLGLALAVLGMGGTLLTLYLLSLVMSLLKRLFPVEEEQPSGPTAGG